MDLDFSEALTKAWKITWKHKTLWGLAFAMAFAAFLFLPLMLAPIFWAVFYADPTHRLEYPLPWLGMALGFALLMVASYGIAPLIRSAMTIGALKAEGGAEKVSFGELLREARPYYLRFFGVTLLLGLAIALVSSAFAAIQAFGIAVTMGLAGLCFAPLSLLVYPLLYAGMVLMELAEAAIVVDGVGVMDSARRAWETMRSNKAKIFLLALAVYLGVGMFSGALVFPFILPMFLAPFFIFDSGELSSGFLWGAGIWMVLFFPVMAFAQGIGMTFIKTAWTLAYLRLARKPENVVIVSESNA